MAPGIEMFVERIFERPRRVVGNDGERALGGDDFAQMISVIGCIGNDDLGRKPLSHQCGGLRCIALLTVTGMRPPPRGRAIHLRYSLA